MEDAAVRKGPVSDDLSVEAGLAAIQALRGGELSLSVVMGTLVGNEGTIALFDVISVWQIPYWACCCYGVCVLIVLGSSKLPGSLLVPHSLLLAEVLI